MNRNAELRLQPLLDWLMDGARPARNLQDGVRLLCERFAECGLRLHRLAVFVKPLHPNVAARAFYWDADRAAIEVSDEDHGFMSTDEYLASPIRLVSSTRQEVRVRLAEPGTRADFPVLDELRARGFTDYLITPLEFVHGDVHVMSVATKSPGGFTEAELAGIHRIKPAMTRVVEIFGLQGRARNILDAYLGRHAGARVLQGQIERGHVEQLHAVIWFCDLRDSTALAELMGAQKYLAMLNEYFECVLDPVLERRGEVLSFIGDAALAIFPVGSDATDAASRAVAAARDAISRVQVLNERRDAAQAIPLGFGIGLHIGDLLYGNVGTRSRIAFTVVGAAANEAARIEALCKTLDASPLVSADVARLAPGEWRSLGTHQLRGVGKPIELFTF